jgi:hypothetical protein
VSVWIKAEVVKIYVRFEVLTAVTVMLSSGVLHRVALVRPDVPPKRRLLQEPHCVTSRNTAFFLVERFLLANGLHNFRSNVSRGNEH